VTAQQEIGESVGGARRRNGGRSGRNRRREESAEAGRRMPDPRLTRLRNPYRPLEIFSSDQIEAIHETSITILEDMGLRVLDPEAREVFRRGGAEVDEATMTVRLGRDAIMSAVAQAPATVELRARNRQRDVTLGGDRVAFGMVGGPPYVSDLDRGRRAGSLADFEDFLRLAQSFDIIHALGPSAEPMDVPPELRHIAFTRSQLLFSDKVPFVYCRGDTAVEEAMELIRMGLGLDSEAFEAQACCGGVANVNSPLQLDVPMARGIMAFARRGQFMMVTPFTLAGAMAPITLAGALAQQNAEALAGITLGQFVRPGAPMGYGGFTSNVDMRSGAPAFGTPEYVQAAFATGQLARRYRLPFRSSNVNASNAPDAQAAYESQMSLWGAIMGGANMLIHGAGWLEGGLTASFEKFILDIEMLQMFAALFQVPEVDTQTLALEAQREVGPGGHFFGATHTMSRYAGAFYAPLVSDWRNFETWRESGAEDAARRANRIWKETLAAYRPPPLEPERVEAIEAFAEERGYRPKI
jgi:trimethylamine--corrinoid protein Co-methyltransferase